MSQIEDVDDSMALAKAFDLKWFGPELKGKVTVSKKYQEIINRLNESESVEIEVRRDGLITIFSNVCIGDEVDIALMPPRGSRCCLAKDEQDLLAIFNLHLLPENFALLDTGFKTWEPVEQCHQPALIAASRLVKKLENDSIFEVSGNRFALMTYDNKVYLTYSISSEVVVRTAKVVEIGLARLEQFFSDVLHSNEKKRILRNALISSLKSCDESTRLSHLLAHCDEIFENAQQNYELFISNFSFQNDLDKLNEQKRDFSVKLNGLLIGIQGKLLAIPVSTILATTQLKDTGDENYITINCAVMASSVIFLVIIFWLIRSQMVAINAIKHEIVQKERRFRVEIPRLFNEVRVAFGSLRTDCNLNLKMAWSLVVLSVVLTLITLHVFLLKTFGLSLGAFSKILLVHICTSFISLKG